MKDEIRNFLKAHHVMSLATSFWSAPCFYIFVEDHFLLFKSSPDSRHIREIQKNNPVSGSMYVETKDIAGIQGLQFEGICLEATEMESNIYHQAFPVAEHIEGVVYKIEMTLIHLTDNTKGFGTKIIWKNI